MFHNFAVILRSVPLTTTTSCLRKSVTIAILFFAHTTLGHGMDETINEMKCRLERHVVHVELKFDSQANSNIFRTSRWGGVRDYHKNIHHLTAESIDGETLSVTPLQDGRWRVHNRNQPFRIQYEVRHEKPAFMNGRFGHQQPTLMDDWVLLFGYAYLLEPEDSRLTERPIDITIENGPFQRNFNSWGGSRVARYRQLIDSILIAGKYRVYESQNGDSKLTIAIQGNWSDSDDQMCGIVRKIATAQSKYMECSPVEDLLVVMVPGESNSSGGTAVRGAIAIYPSPDFPLSQLGSPSSQLLAHEHFHLWVGHLLQGDPQSGEGYYHWFHEGCVEYYAWLTAYREGLLDERGMIRMINRTLIELATNPIATTTTADILADNYWRDSNFNRFPYQKGSLASMLIDLSIRHSTANKKNIDDFVRGLIANTNKGQQPYDFDKLVEALEFVGPPRTFTSWRQFLRQHTVDAAPLPMQSVLNATGIEAATVPTPIFKLGFKTNPSQLAKHAVITEVQSGSNADRAGLQVGDVLEKARIRFGDATTNAKIVVRRQEQEIAIEYLPQHKIEVLQLQNSEANQTRLATLLK